MFGAGPAGAGYRPRGPNGIGPAHWPHPPGEGPFILQEEKVRSELATLWFPSGTAGTVLLVVALAMVVAGIVIGCSKGR